VGRFSPENVEKAVREAIEKAPKRRFEESVELQLVLRDINLKDPANRMNKTLVLPHSPHKNPIKICFIAEGDLALKAKENNVDLILDKAKLQELAGNKRELKKIAKKYDFFFARADMMPLVGRIMGPILGPRGKMPQPLPPTADPKPNIELAKRSIRIRVKNQPIINCKVGHVKQDVKEIVENIMAVVREVENFYKKPGVIRDAYVKTTMGPSVKIKLGG